MRSETRLPRELALWFGPYTAIHTGGNAAYSKSLARVACPLAKGLSGVAWRGVAWRGVAWSGVEWSGVEWSGVEWSGVEWSGVEWRIQHMAFS